MSESLLYGLGQLQCPDYFSGLKPQAVERSVETRISPYPSFRKRFTFYASKINPVGAFPCLLYAFPLLICISVFLHTNLRPSCILIKCLPPRPPSPHFNCFPSTTTTPTFLLFSFHHHNVSLSFWRDNVSKFHIL